MNKSYSIYPDLSADSRTWVNDLRRYDDSFPNIDVLRMDEEDCGVLADYLAADDGTLDTEALQFSRDIADQVRALVTR